MSRAPQHARMKMVLGTIEKNPDNPDAWLNACLRNYEQAQQARVLLGTASVHGRDRARPPSADRGAGGFVAPARPPASPSPPSVTESQGTMARGAQPADEAVVMKEHWPLNKSALISSLMAVLEEEVMERFLALEAEDQCAMCFTYMVTAGKDDTTGTKNWMVKSWLDRLQSLDGPSGRLVPASLSQTVPGRKINVQIILAGMPSIMAGTIVSVCMQAIPSLHRDISVEFMPTIFVAVGTEEITIESVANAYRQNFHEKVHTMQDLSNQFEQLMEEWKKTETKFIFVTNVGIPPTPDEAVSELEPNRLHRSDTEWIWAFCQAAHAVRQHTKDSDVAEIFFGPQAPAFHAQISGLWGELTIASASKHPNVPVPLPQVFSTPSGFNVIPVVDNQPYAMDPIDKWGAPDFAAWMDKHPTFPIAPSMTAKLMVMKLFKERELKVVEEDMVKAILVRADNGSQIGMGRNRFLSLYGYLGTPAEQLLEAALPCCQTVFPTTGDAAQKPSKFTSSCGQQRYCRKCEKLFSIIDRSYPTYVVCDVLLALFTKVAANWSGKIPVESSMWARNSDVGRNHSCGPECPGHL